MQIGSWRFRPKFWPTIFALALFPVLVGLGFWQLDRADQKQALQNIYETRKNAAPARLSGLNESLLLDANAMAWRRLVVEGRYLPDKQFLLDNQTMRGEAGYLVYTPFRLRDRDYLVLINRGWIAVGPERARAPRLPLPGEPLQLQGRAKLPPSRGIVLPHAENENLGNGIIRMQYLDLHNLETHFKLPLLPYVIRLDGVGEDGLLREWREPGFGREKHLGYAFQWFVMSAALAVLYIVLNFKRHITA